MGSAPAIPPPSRRARKQTRRLCLPVDASVFEHSHCAACRGGLRFLKKLGKKAQLLLKIASKKDKNAVLDEQAQIYD